MCIERHSEEKFKEISNLFVIKRAGKELQYNERQELVPQMSPILLQTFVEAIEGSYDVSNYQQKVLKLKVGSARVEFEFTVCAEEE